MTDHKQTMTVSIRCTQKCPSDLPDTCVECPHMYEANIKVIEVLSDQRHPGEEPPPMDKFGKPIDAPQSIDGELCPM